MDFTSQDIALIDQALRIAIRTQQDESKADPYYEVLSKLQARADMALIAYTTDTMHDRGGFRFDYDDFPDHI
ncbi:hypothetical protein ACFQI7_12915 [Paenibacillus allorhizosphaerae]|uniref:Uncharacterized protein n=1 Tax=Paenibacillus allorhizosphaerae TaxID=2849866 RepID=A0ABM8VL75_9BACL|nr:hypothetical protein [Paenibacillus allorhizosphaerae]CAG7648235.1 hypothetical protein PAECIP111802_04158 [Paenibacillus allorhizosphaerae]